MIVVKHRAWIGTLLLVALSAGLGGCETSSRGEAQQAMNDESISAAVQAMLTGDRSSNFTRVDVRSDQGVVSLVGVVPSARQRARAEELTRNVEGVKRVSNQLMIQNQEKQAQGN